MKQYRFSLKKVEVLVYVHSTLCFCHTRRINTNFGTPNYGNVEPEMADLGMELNIMTQLNCWWGTNNRIFMWTWQRCPDSAKDEHDDVELRYMDEDILMICNCNLWWSLEHWIIIYLQVLNIEFDRRLLIFQFMCIHYCMFTLYNFA